jgi:hypothetical protein
VNPNRVPAAYNQSIYVMLTVPYLLLGVFGFLIYRGMKKNEEFRSAQGALVECGKAPLTSA